jgi:pimeloyl-ACP methyl ester carboxylesterase
VVCPSLPGYGFSDKPTRPGWGVDRIASAWARLMARLGYPTSQAAVEKSFLRLQVVSGDDSGCA